MKVVTNVGDHVDVTQVQVSHILSVMSSSSCRAHHLPLSYTLSYTLNDTLSDTPTNTKYTQLSQYSKWNSVITVSQAVRYKNIPVIKLKWVRLLLQPTVVVGTPWSVTSPGRRVSPWICWRYILIRYNLLQHHLCFVWKLLFLSRNWKMVYDRM